MKEARQMITVLTGTTILFLPMIGWVLSVLVFAFIALFEVWEEGHRKARHAPIQVVGRVSGAR